jgi:hypothetical protein
VEELVEEDIQRANSLYALQDTAEAEEIEMITVVEDEVDTAADTMTGEVIVATEENAVNVVSIAAVDAEDIEVVSATVEATEEIEVVTVEDEEDSVVIVEVIEEVDDTVESDIVEASVVMVKVLLVQMDPLVEISRPVRQLVLPLVAMREDFKTVSAVERIMFLLEQVLYLVLFL